MDPQSPRVLTEISKPIKNIIIPTNKFKHIHTIFVRILILSNDNIALADNTIEHSSSKKHHGL